MMIVEPNPFSFNTEKEFCLSKQKPVILKLSNMPGKVLMDEEIIGFLIVR